MTTSKDASANQRAAAAGDAAVSSQTASETQSNRASPKHSDPLSQIWLNLRDWWSSEVSADISHAKVLRRIAEESSTTPRYLFMICMSAGIAVLGLLLSSPAVVIGAMLLSPLMGPIIGAGFALAEGKFKWLRLCARAIFIGTLVAILFCAAIVWLSPLQTMTSEIAARTRPNLFDLLVALFSSLAGSYAMIRGREGTIVGVAIATALMPPLAVVGYGLATFNMTVFGGALLLYVTNLLTIALTATLMARLYGFRYVRSSKHTMTENLGIGLTFTLLAIPLGISLLQIAREANGQRIVNTVIEESFDPRAFIEQPVVDWSAEPVQVNATVFTPEFRADANEEIGRRLSSALDEQVLVSVTQIQGDTDPTASEQAALARARAQQQAEDAEAQITSLAQRLALIAGTSASSVTIDRDNRRALVTAQPLEGLTLAGYRALEARAAAQTPGWSIQLRPPILDLPDITLGLTVDENNAQESVEGGSDSAAATILKPDAAGVQALDLILWAASRTDIPVALSGSASALAAVLPLFEEQGIAVVASTRPGESAGSVTARWSIGVL
jgi:uncharacterized hydrophobic protein (TIGR00271 family)